MADKIFENGWDCPACGKVGNSAFKQKFCPECGSPKTSQDEEYMMGEITNKEDLKVAGKTKDWICSSCGITNYQKNNFCEKCGNPKEADDKVHKKISYGATPPKSGTEARERSHPKPKVKETSDDSYTSVPMYSSPSSYSPEPSRIQSSLNSFAEKTGVRIDQDTLKVGATITGALLVIAILLFTIFHTTSINGTVSAFNWTRDIPIEHYITVRHTHQSSQPAGAYNVRSYEESHQEPVSVTTSHYESATCYDYTNNGDGTTSRDPYECGHDVSETHIDHYDTVWDTYYDYDRDEWVYSRTVHAQGSDHEAYWPEFSLNLGGQTVIGAERTGSYSESYSVVFTTYNKDEERKDYSISPNYDEWSQYKMEESYPLKINIYGAVMNDPLKDRSLLNAASSSLYNLLK